MRNLVKFAFVICVTMLIIPSCNKEATNNTKDYVYDSNNDPSGSSILTVDEAIRTSMEKVEQGIIFTVEQTTFDELNQMFAKANLPLLDPERFSKNKYSRRHPCTNYAPCAAWIDHADWNNDNKLSGLDLVQVQSYRCSLGNCNGSYPTYGLIDKAIEFGFISALCDGVNAWNLETDDLDSVIDYILGHNVCSN